ncbi:hypothetical protein AVEN_246180-1 [Araneus ventricosus]|uniref:Uncharacterized protein n=1 Tax=Araneus ventricosus TaxID=182803 RepID=A0A4Y2J2S9_ARAVE|nr:hypothetical protein AVEN_246180-1 [Araneus ventricosus]
MDMKNGKSWFDRLEEEYVAVIEELSKERPAEDESDASDIDEEMTEHIDYEIDSEIDVEDNLIHKENSDSNSNRNVCIIHPSNL